MRRRALKKKVLNILEKSAPHELVELLSTFEEKEIITHLFTALCSTNERCKWNGVLGFGIVVPHIANQDLESARVVMRRFLWSLNDESGGIGWGAPEAMAEVMVHHDTLFSEYSHMIISYMREDGPELLQDGNYLELPALQRGLLWGVARLTSVKKNEMLERGVVLDLLHYLDSQDLMVRGLAALCLQLCGTTGLGEQVDELMKSTYSFDVYWGNGMKTFTHRDLAGAIA